ncbi:hypothetical protein P3T76_015541 [Phytophthora citrophthora]|uniref:RanBP2-type domain-containing protein n=1 Tax=Phytophthora citrophthora TaxID=4793 RepID=A0AAD9FZ99_9STRA|nr:hypothetical protein P3T76_015541 [Phytophthora citrophthora]
MARVWKTGVQRDAVLHSSAPIKKGKARRKRTAKQIRAAKIARAAARAATAATDSGETVPENPPCTTAEDTGSGTEVRAQWSSHDPVVASPPPNVTKTGYVSDSRAKKAKSGYWVCRICKFTNATRSRCTRCKCARVRCFVDDAIVEAMDAVQAAEPMNCVTTSTKNLTVAPDQPSTATKQTPTASRHTLTATKRTPTATKRTTIVAEETTTPDQLYYEIYGGYYTGRDISVDRRFATTVEVWEVAYINDRREGALGMEYRVLWVHPDRSCKKLYQRTWEPAVKLREDDFSEEMAVVDRWKASDVPVFEDFWRTDQVGVGLLGADEDNLCVFNALKRAAELLDRPDLVTQQDIEQFVEDRLVLYNQDLREGATWVYVRDFMIRLRDAGRDISYNAFVKTNYMTPGRRGARVMREITLGDGVYIVAAYNHSHVGHAAVLTVQGNTRLVYDKNDEQGKPISSTRGWINFYAFIRPFIIFK